MNKLIDCISIDHLNNYVISKYDAQFNVYDITTIFKVLESMKFLSIISNIDSFEQAYELLKYLEKYNISIKKHILKIYKKIMEQYEENNFYLFTIVNYNNNSLHLQNKTLIEKSAGYPILTEQEFYNFISYLKLFLLEINSMKPIKIINYTFFIKEKIENKNILNSELISE